MSLGAAEDDGHCCSRDRWSRTASSARGYIGLGFAEASYDEHQR